MGKRRGVAVADKLGKDLRDAGNRVRFSSGSGHEKGYRPLRRLSLAYVQRSDARRYSEGDILKLAKQFPYRPKTVKSTAKQSTSLPNVQ